MHGRGKFLVVALEDAAAGDRLRREYGELNGILRDRLMNAVVFESGKQIVDGEAIVRAECVSVLNAHSVGQRESAARRVFAGHGKQRLRRRLDCL